jgi:hypothetical protein
MKKLNITVAGHTNTGKSTVAQLIKEALHEHGIPSIIKDERLSVGWMMNQAKRLEGLRKDALEVGIEVVQVSREPTRQKKQQVILVKDETAGLMLFKDLKALEADLKERGFDASSDYPLLMENLLRGESFATKTTSYEWYAVNDGPIEE